MLDGCSEEDVSGLKQDVVAVLKTDVSVLKRTSRAQTDVGDELKENFRGMDGKLDRVIHWLGMPPS